MERDWHSWLKSTEDCAVRGRNISQTLKSLTITTSKIKKKTLPLLLFLCIYLFILFFLWVAKKKYQSSQSGRQTSSYSLAALCRVCGGNTDFFFSLFFSLTCFVLFYFSLFKHWETSLHRNEPTRRVSLGTKNYAASYWSDVSTILCSTYNTDAHTHTGTIICKGKIIRTHMHAQWDAHTSTNGSMAHFKRAGK